MTITELKNVLFASTLDPILQANILMHAEHNQEIVDESGYVDCDSDACIEFLSKNCEWTEDDDLSDEQQAEVERIGIEALREHFRESLPDLDFGFATEHYCWLSKGRLSKDLWIGMDNQGL